MKIKVHALSMISHITCGYLTYYMWISNMSKITIFFIYIKKTIAGPLTMAPDNIKDYNKKNTPKTKI